MNYNLSVEVIGGKELEDLFERSPEIVIGNLKDALNKTAFTVEGKAKSYAPVQYTVLRGSITTQRAEAQGNNVIAKVGTNIEYAPYQEYGTGIYGKSRRMIRPIRAKVLAWKKNGQWIFARAVRGVKGKLFFKRARDESQPIMVNFMKEALGNIVSILAG